MRLIDTLAPLRAHGGLRTTGLDDATVLAFAARDPQLGEAIAAAAAEYASVRAEFPELLELDEDATEYDCPVCENPLLVVLHPDMAQVQAAAAEGNAEAQEQLDIIASFPRPQ